MEASLSGHHEARRDKIKIPKVDYNTVEIHKSQKRTEHETVQWYDLLGSITGH